MTPSLINTLEWLGIVLNRCIAPIIFIFGIMDFIFNLIIFTRQTFFRQSCFLYLIATAINNLVMFLIGLLTRILDNGFQVNLFGGNSNIYCQIRTYLVYTLFAISSWFFVFASLDRFYSTNKSALKRRRFCSKQMALKLICLTIIICILIHIHIIIYYEYISELNPFDQWSLTCTTNNFIYTIFFSLFMLIFYSLLPLILMGIIGLLTLYNIRKSRQRIQPVMNNTFARRDRNQLIKTLSIQIIILIIFATPHSCYWIYVAFTSSQHSIKTNYIRAYERFALNIVRILLYVNYGSSFYVQIIVSKRFRQEFIQIFLNIKGRFTNF
jgi:hypothetical protein